jgi:hypothetical protein
MNLISNDLQFCRSHPVVPVSLLLLTPHDYTRILKPFLGCSKAEDYIKLPPPPYCKDLRLREYSGNSTSLSNFRNTFLVLVSPFD